MAQNFLADLQRDYNFYTKSIATKRMMKIVPGMQMMHLRVLKFVAVNPDTSQQELVVSSGRDKGQVARISKELQEMGLIKRQKDNIDKRKYKLKLTAKGVRIEAKIDALFSVLEDELLIDIDKSQLKVYTSVLANMLETAKRLR